MVQWRRRLAASLATVTSSGRRFYLQVTYTPDGYQFIGTVFAQNGGLPVKICNNLFLLAALAATRYFLHVFVAVSDAVGLFCVFLAAAAAAAQRRPQGGSRRDRGRMTLGLTPTPNDGSSARVPAVTSAGANLRKWRAVLQAERRRRATMTPAEGDRTKTDQCSLPVPCSDAEPAGRGIGVNEKADVSAAWWQTPLALRQFGGRRP